MPAPAIALFTYNRPHHTAAVLRALARNRPERLIVFQDGLKAGHEAAAHAEVTKLIEAIDFAQPEIVRRERNLGLAESIIRGVTQVLAEHETILVLEDDCVPSTQLVSYSQWALERFRAEQSVFSISGYALPSFPSSYSYDVCFSPLSSSWAWASWRDRWQKFDAFAAGWEETLSDAEERRRFAAPGSLFPLMLRQQMAGQVNSWAIRWYYTLFKHRAACVWPLRSFVRNIGMDGTGEHGVRTTEFDVELCEMFDPTRVRVPDSFDFSPEIARAFRRSFSAYSLETLRRVLANPRSWPRVARQLASSFIPPRRRMW